MQALPAHTLACRLLLGSLAPSLQVPVALNLEIFLGSAEEPSRLLPRGAHHFLVCVMNLLYVCVYSFVHRTDPVPSIHSAEALHTSLCCRICWGLNVCVPTGSKQCGGI